MALHTQNLRRDLRGKSLLIELTCRGKCVSALQQQGPAQAQTLPVPMQVCYRCHHLEKVKVHIENLKIW